MQNTDTARSHHLISLLHITPQKALNSYLMYPIGRDNLPCHVFLPMKGPHRKGSCSNDPHLSLEISIPYSSSELISVSSTRRLCVCAWSLPNQFLLPTEESKPSQLTCLQKARIIWAPLPRFNLPSFQISTFTDKPGDAAFPTSQLRFLVSSFVLALAIVLQSGWEH